MCYCILIYTEAQAQSRIAILTSKGPDIDINCDILLKQQ